MKLLAVKSFFIKLADNILHPLKDMPVPDFNNQYDSSML